LDFSARQGDADLVDFLQTEMVRARRDCKRGMCFGVPAHRRNPSRAFGKTFCVWLKLRWRGFIARIESERNVSR
jgi:hypothetical protein